MKENDKNNEGESFEETDEEYDEEYDSYVPGEVYTDKGIPLLNDAIPLDEEQLKGQDGPKKIKRKDD